MRYDARIGAIPPLLLVLLAFFVVTPTKAQNDATTQPATQPASTQAAKADKVRAAMAAEANARQSRQKKLVDAVKQLADEANDLDNFEKPTVNIRFTRPHPALASLGPDDAKDVMTRAVGSFTGNEYRDTYIRWHLFWAIMKADDGTRRAMGFDAIKLVKMIPLGLNVKEQPEYTYEPEENWERYRTQFTHNYIPNPPIIVEGYPPFQRRIGPPAVWAKLGAGSEEAYKQAVEEGKKKNEDQERRAKEWLAQPGNKFERIFHPGARAFNYRLEAFNRITYQYRGEVIYFLMMTGDPEILKILIKEIDMAANAKSGLAIELLQYVYLGAFDGALNLYDESVLKECGVMLKKTAREHENYSTYASQPRNFAEYAFHLIYLLEDGGGGLINPKEAKAVPGRRTRLNNP